MSSEASLDTRVKVWWSSVPFTTRSTLVVCVAVYLMSAIFGLDNFGAVCLAPHPVVMQLQVYRFITAALTHGGLLHLAFNMLALVPVGALLERQLGSLQLLWLMLLICLLGGVTYVAIAYLAAAVLPASVPALLQFMSQCAVGLSGVIFGLVVVELSLSGAPTRSIFGLYSVPAKAYPWLLLVIWQLLVPHASFLGHLTGLLLGQLYVVGLLKWAMLNSGTYHRIERSPLCAKCMHSSSSSFIAHAAGGDSPLPVSRPPGYQSVASGSPAARSGSGWLRGPWMAFPPSSDRLTSLLTNPFQQQQTQQQQQQPPPAGGAPQGVRLGGAQPPADDKAAAAAAAEARLAVASSSSGRNSKAATGGGGGSSANASGSSSAP